jgi:hypothetical protein
MTRASLELMDSLDFLTFFWATIVSSAMHDQLTVNTRYLSNTVHFKLLNCGIIIFQCFSAASSIISNLD